jgi:hypothetical protein
MDSRTARWEPLSHGWSASTFKVAICGVYVVLRIYWITHAPWHCLEQANVLGYAKYTGSYVYPFAAHARIDDSALLSLSPVPAKQVA